MAYRKPFGNNNRQPADESDRFAVRIQQASLVHSSSREAIMNKSFVSIILFISLFASCAMNKSIKTATYKPKTVPTDYSQKSDGGFICFFTKDKLIAAFPCGNSENLKDYIGKATISIGPGNHAYRMIDLVGDALVVRELKDISEPTAVRIIDLTVKKDLIKTGFTSSDSFATGGFGNTVLKRIGSRLDSQQQRLLKSPIENMEAYAENLFKTGYAIDFYRVFQFDFGEKTLTDTNQITPVIYRRHNFM
jgi:hypothetical protein